MFVHLKKGLADSGRIVHIDDVRSIVDENRNTDWYTSSYKYTEEAVKYFEENIQTNKKGEEYPSISGYPGLAVTNNLYWDIDSTDFEKARQDALKIADALESFSGDKHQNAMILAFSGNKGFHIVLQTTTEFSPEETRNICESVATKVGADIDTVVYNKTRAFRILNTKHQSSGLYKIELSYNELKNWSEDQIKSFAKQKRDELEHIPAGGAFFKERFGKKEVNVKNILKFNKEKELNPPPPCPSDMRSCIHNLEHGFFLAGTRESALIRLAAYSKGNDLSREETHGTLVAALEKRAERYPDTKPWEDSDNERILDLVFSPRWKGGTYTCKTDRFLKEHCDGEGLCAEVTLGDEDKVKSFVLTASQLGEKIRHDYSKLDRPYPKIGLEWLDSQIRLQPKSYTIINGSNGSGKTSLIVKSMEQLNKDEVYHMFYSLDMSDNGLFFKLGARYTPYSATVIEDAFTPLTINKVIQEEVAAIIRHKFPYTLFEFGSSHTVFDLKEIILQTQKERNINISVVFIDYIGKLIGKFEDSRASATLNSHALLDTVKATGAHWIVLSQIARSHGDHTSPLYTSRVAKDSSSWEENATHVLNVWRPFGSGVESKDEEDLDKYFHIYIAKNRSGGPAEMVFGWNGKRGDIFTMSPDEYLKFAMLSLKFKKGNPPRNIYDVDYKIKLRGIKDEVESEQTEDDKNDFSLESRVSGKRRKGGY